MKNVVDIIEADRNLAIMSRGIKLTGMNSKLAEKGPFTVFAPSDIAFSRISKSKMADLMEENNRDYTELLSHHVVDKRLSFSDLKDGLKFLSINGKILTVTVVAGKITVNGSVIQRQDNNGSNGVVHSLDCIIE